MPLTEVQLEAIETLMNAPGGIQELLSRLCRQRDNILALAEFHNLLTDPVATAVLTSLREAMNATAEELAALIP
jgi:hypothetical protein